MDGVALQTLRDEMQDDGRLIQDALRKAVARFERSDEIAYEACAHQLCRLYNAFEQLCLRVAKAFEDHIDDPRGWHTSLLNRLAIKIEGIRPALIPPELKPPLQELEAFGHVFVHACELRLDPDRLGLLLKYARAVAERAHDLIEDFVSKVAQEQQIDL